MHWISGNSKSALRSFKPPFSPFSLTEKNILYILYILYILICVSLAPVNEFALLLLHMHPTTHPGPDCQVSAPSVELRERSKKWKTAICPNANQHKITEKRIAYFRFSGSYARGFVPRPMLEQTWPMLKDRNIFSCKKLAFSRKGNRCFDRIKQVICKTHEFSFLENDNFLYEKNISVFQHWPRLLKHGSRNKPSCAERK